MKGQIVNLPYFKQQTKYFRAIGRFLSAKKGHFRHVSLLETTILDSKYLIIINI